MKKTIISAFFLLITAASLLLSSCNTQTGTVDTSSKNNVTDPVITTYENPGTETGKPGAVTDNPGTEKPETGGTVTTGQPTGTGEPSPREIPGTEIATGFTRLPLELTGYVDDFLIIGDRIVVNVDYDEGTSDLIIYDLFTCEEIARRKVLPYSHLLKLDEGDSFMVYSYLGSYCRFDDPVNLEMTESKEIEEEVPEYGETSDMYTYFADSTYVCMNYVDVSCGRAGEDPFFETVLPATYSYASCVGKRGDLIYLTANLAFTDRSALIELNTVTGELKALKALDGYYNVQMFGDRLIYSENRSDHYTVIDLLNPYAETNVYMVLGEESASYVGADRIITSGDRTDKLNVFIYGYDGALYFGEPLFECDGYLRACRETEHGLFAYIVCFPDENGDAERMIVRIDFSALHEIDRTDYNLLAKELELKIEKEFGFELLTGVDAMIDFPGFVGKISGGGYDLFRAEQMVYDTLSEFPEGFIAELFSDTGKGNCTEFIMCLTGDLDPTEYGSTSDPIAYAYYTAETQYIVVDINHYYSMRSTIAHELMHAIDRYLAALTDYNAYPNWSKYLPKKFKYNNSYIDGYGNDYNDSKYTMWGSSDTYFIDSYSKTFDLEDRARLFENMFTADEYSSFLDYPRILDRMGYLASVIRANFTSVSGSDEIPIWERCLQTAFKTAA